MTFSAPLTNPRVPMSCFFFSPPRSDVLCVDTKGLLPSAVTNQIRPRVLRTHRRRIRRQHELELNYDRKHPFTIVFPAECSPAPDHLHYFNNIYHVALSALAFPQCPSLISPEPKSMLRVDNFPHVHSTFIVSYTVQCYSSSGQMSSFFSFFLLPVAPTIPS